MPASANPPLAFRPATASCGSNCAPAKTAPWPPCAPRPRRSPDRGTAKDGLTVTFETHDDFAATVNDADAITRLTAALDALHIPHDDRNLPLRGSEDFGRFGDAGTKMAMMFLGSGEKHPQLHNPDYDFPDSLIPLGARLFQRVMTDILG